MKSEKEQHHTHSTEIVDRMTKEMISIFVPHGLLRKATFKSMKAAHRMMGSRHTTAKGRPTIATELVILDPIILCAAFIDLNVAVLSNP